MQYPLHVTYFGHTQVLKEKRKPYLRWKVGGNCRWPSNVYKPSQAVIQRGKATGKITNLMLINGTSRVPFKFCQVLFKFKLCQELSEHDRVMNREQAQSNRETTAEMQIALTVNTKAREQKRAHRSQGPNLGAKTCRMNQPVTSNKHVKTWAPCSKTQAVAGWHAEEINYTDLLQQTSEGEDG